MANTPTTNFAIPKPAAGDINWEEEYAQFADLVDSRLMLGGMKNALLNGNFDIWQRGTSFASLSNVFTADRFWSGAEDGAGTVTRQSFALGQTDVPGNPKYFWRHDRTSAASTASTLLAQSIESVLTFAGETVTVSFHAKTGAAKTLQVDFVQGFGTGGTPSADVNVTAQNIDVTPSWQRFKLTFAIPSLAGKTLGTSGDDRLLLRIREVSSFSTFILDVSQVQVEKGSVVTEFEQRPVGQELDACRRYFERRGGTAAQPVAVGQAANSTNAEVVISYREKRANPSITFSSQTQFDVRSASSVSQTTAINVQQAGRDMAMLNPVVAGGFNAGDAAVLRPLTSNDFVSIDAEL